MKIIVKTDSFSDIQEIIKKTQQTYEQFKNTNINPNDNIIIEIDIRRT